MISPTKSRRPMLTVRSKCQSNSSNENWFGLVWLVTIRLQCLLQLHPSDLFFFRQSDLLDKLQSQIFSSAFSRREVISHHIYKPQFLNPLTVTPSYQSVRCCNRQLFSCFFVPDAPTRISNGVSLWSFDLHDPFLNKHVINQKSHCSTSNTNSCSFCSGRTVD